MSSERQLNDDVTEELVVSDNEQAAREQIPQEPPQQEEQAQREKLEAAQTAAETEAAEEVLTVEQLQATLGEERKKAREYWEGLLRARAELENLRKRSAREVENAFKFGLERLVSEFLPVKDSIELGLSASEGAVDLESLREGMALTLKMLGAALERCGVKEVSGVGEKFDPQFHQAMTMQEAAEAEPGTVLSVMQKGYLLHDRLLRPAMVIVARKPDA